MLCPTGRWKTDVQNPAVRTVQKRSDQLLRLQEAWKWCNFFGDGTEYIIPFSCIKRIGPDLILVEIHEEK